MPALSRSINLSKSYLEIENYVIVDMGPVTREILQYEDYELSAESFLIEINRTEMLPNMRMPVPEPLSGERRETRREWKSRAIDKKGRRESEDRRYCPKDEMSSLELPSPTFNKIVRNWKGIENDSTHLWMTSVLIRQSVLKRRKIHHAAKEVRVSILILTF
jgi:hypothetical protein